MPKPRPSGSPVPTAGREESVLPGVVLHDPNERAWLRFERPLGLVVARSAADVLPALGEVTRAVSRGAVAAGFLAYEAAPAFDPSLAVRPDGSGFPLLWFGLFSGPERLRRARPPADAGDAVPPPPDRGPAPNGAWRADVGRAEYDHAIRSIHRLIEAGDTYQVNYTYRLRQRLAEDPWSLFSRMVHGQGAAFSAFVQLDRFSIASASPELFFRLEGHELTSRPMKGTAARGRSAREDGELAEGLRRSEKNRAENLMIVDMVRNDFGRIAETGSVRVPRLFDLERLPSVWQMTSEVRCRTDASLPAILRALFPAASITGAPKVRTTEIIASLETSPRRIYTGAIGYLAPGRALLNVAIRTALADRARGEVEYGVGGGIVADSRPDEEWDECALKARIVTRGTCYPSLYNTRISRPWSGASSGGVASCAEDRSTRT